MANVSVRNLDDGVRDELRRRADRAGHSMEAEIRIILTDATRGGGGDDPFTKLIARAKEIGGVELEMPSDEFDSEMDIDGTRLA